MDHFKEKFTKLVVEQSSPMVLYSELQDIHNNLTRGLIAGGKITLEHYDLLVWLIEILEITTGEFNTRTSADTEQYVEKSYQKFLDNFSTNDPETEHWLSIWKDYKNVFFEVVDCLSAYHTAYHTFRKSSTGGDFLSQVKLLKRLVDCIKPEQAVTA